MARLYAQARKALLGGMIAATILSVFFVPAFFVLTQGLSDWWGRRQTRRS
jgi:multidrug efflux pump subunit AcrB